MGSVAEAREPGIAPLYPPAAMRGSASLFGLANTKVTPVDLAWSLGDGLFVSTAFGLYAPTGHWGANTPLDTGAKFWTFEPSAALTNFRDGWNATLHALYNTNARNPSNHYYSGDQLFLNGTLTRNFVGKAYAQFMFTQDVYARSNFEGAKVWLNLSFKLF